MEDTMKEFVAYSKKLLWILKQIRDLLEESRYDEAKVLLDRLIDDTQGDIEA